MRQKIYGLLVIFSLIFLAGCHHKATPKVNPINTELATFLKKEPYLSFDTGTLQERIDSLQDFAKELVVTIESNEDYDANRIILKKELQNQVSSEDLNSLITILGNSLENIIISSLYPEETDKVILVKFQYEDAQTPFSGNSPDHPKKFDIYS